MRELHGYHGEHRRHAHDAVAAADAPGGHARDRVHDAPRHEARDALKLKMLLDPGARKAERLRYEKAVDEAYHARHAAGQLKPQEAKPEHAPPETRDRPASRLAEKWDSAESQREERRRPERSRLPTNETTQMVAGIGVAFSSVADALNVLPGRWDAVAASFLGAVVAGVAWGNKRWRDRRGNRPED